MDEKLIMTPEWDKTFPKSDKVNHSKVTFHNKYGITLAADLYVPKNAVGNLQEKAAGIPVIWHPLILTQRILWRQ